MISYSYINILLFLARQEEKKGTSILFSLRFHQGLRQNTANGFVHTGMATLHVARQDLVRLG